MDSLEVPALAEAMMMTTPSRKNQSFTEIVCIGAIVSLILFFELTFGTFSNFAYQLFQSLPQLKKIFTGLFLGAWLGLGIYSLRRRVEIRQEKKARTNVEADFALYRVIDEVTGLPNLSGFIRLLSDQMKADRLSAVSVLGLEICNFDTTKSLHGSDAAHAIELGIANHLVSVTGDYDFVARGDHAAFYIVLADEDAEEHGKRLERVIDSTREFVRKGVATDTTILQANVHFGVLNLHERAAALSKWGAEDVIRRVDFALYQLRDRDTGATLIFNDEMESTLNIRAFVEASIDEAIQKRQIVACFQPLINLKEHRVTGFEVLARWNESKAGPIPPSIFIPIAEDIGALGMLTLSVLEQACLAARNWPEDIRFAINVSPSNLSDPELISQFLAIIDKHSIDPKRIEIEITENALVEEGDAISDVISRLKEAGLTISIDDFGTGYSSLHHLRILPFDKIKIDQCFIKDLSKNKESLSIVQAIIALGKSLGLTTTAEGIEDAANQEMLKHLGCDTGQGFLFAKAMDSSEISRFLLNFNEYISQEAKAA